METVQPKWAVLTRPIRTFIAVPIPEAVKGRIADLLQGLVSTGADVKWVRVDAVHLTLKFLGDVERERISAVTGAVRRAVSGFPKTAVHLAGTGAYPDIRRPRVLWVGVAEGSDRLRSLAEKVDAALAGDGFERETRPFSAHLTLGRVRSPRGVADAVSRMREANWDGGVFEADTVAVMQSDLQRTGAVYTALATIPLQGS